MRGRLDQQACICLHRRKAIWLSLCMTQALTQEQVWTRIATLPGTGCTWGKSSQQGLARYRKPAFDVLIKLAWTSGESQAAKSWPRPARASGWGEGAWEERRWKRGSFEWSVSMAMGPEAGQNFLSGNKQRLPFTITQTTLATLAAGMSGPGEGRAGRGCQPFFCWLFQGLSVKPLLKAKAGGAAGMQGPFWPPDHVLEAQGPATLQTGLWALPTCPASPGWHHKGPGHLHSGCHHSLFDVVVFTFNSFRCVCVRVCVSHSVMPNSIIPWIVAHQAPLSMGFSRQEHWRRLPFPSPRDLPHPGIKPRSPALQADSLPSEPPEKQSWWETLACYKYYENGDPSSVFPDLTCINWGITDI